MKCRITYVIGVACVILHNQLCAKVDKSKINSLGNMGSIGCKLLHFQGKPPWHILYNFDRFISHGVTDIDERLAVTPRKSGLNPLVIYSCLKYLETSQPRDEMEGGVPM